MKGMYIVDASNYIFRSYYAIRHMTNSKKVATNAIFGFVRSIQKLQKDLKPEYLVVVFDGPRNKESRTAIYEQYKGHRAKAPDDLYPQIDFARNFCKAFGIPTFEVDGHEADDTIGSIARFAKSQKLHSYLCSSDKDFCQLVDASTSIVHTHKNNTELDQNSVETKYGISPSQFIDYLAIVGDSSDNIPGIKGFGPKTATTLLQEYGSLDTLLEKAHEIKNAKRAAKIEEEKDNAILSYKLATINTELEIPKKLDFYAVKETTKDEKIAFLEEMEFKSMLKEIEQSGSLTKTKEITGSYSLINDEKSLDEAINTLKTKESVCIYLLSDDARILQKELYGISFCAEKSKAYYLPFSGSISAEKIDQSLQDLFASKARIIGHDIKKDMHTLASYDLTLNTVQFDTLLASFITESHFSKHDLLSTSQRKLGITLKEIKDLGLEKKRATVKDLSLEQATSYCCKRADVIFALFELFTKEVEEKGFSSLFYDLELPLLHVLYEMEEHGIFLDKANLDTYKEELVEQIHTLSAQIYEEAGKEFNINSPKQLSDVLFSDLLLPKVKGTSTGAEVLANLEKSHPIIPLISSYRMLEKLRSTYADALPKEINPNTRRIHTTFCQSGAVTGRLSSLNPNLQNIPVRTEEGRKIREAFIPEKKGWVFLSLDYSQIELRILAHLSKEERLIDAFNNDKDIHKETAALVFDLPVDQVTDTMRYQAKAVNFGILYGQKAFGLARELQIDLRSAKKFIDKYFEKYPKIKQYMNLSIENAKKSKKTVSLLGRERLLPDIDSKNFAIKAANERFAINAPIQGTQADIIKLAMLEVEKKLKKERVESYMVLQIHDELIFECPENEVDRVKNLIKEAMEGAYRLSVPIKVDVSIGKNWKQC